MAAEIAFFPVDNGDMTLITLESGKTILIDCNIRDVSGDDPPPDVLEQLKARLKTDAKGRHFVDAFLLSHPDLDHCRGFEDAFYLGTAASFPEKSDLILIKEIWSSPLVFRRKRRHETLSDDASAFNEEARRRVRNYRDCNKSGKTVVDGDRIQVLGEDESAEKQEGLDGIVVKPDTNITKLCGVTQTEFRAYLLAPQPKGSEEEENERSKNNSSVIARFEIAAGGRSDACRFLTGGDADVYIWERLWTRHKDKVEVLQYDVMLTPHHCSWHTLSHDSASKMGDKAKVSPEAKSALSQAKTNARIFASCKQILDDDDDPPSYKAKLEYVAIAKAKLGQFYQSSEFKGEPYELEITSAGPSPKKIRSGSGNGGSAAGGAGAGAVGSTPLGHG